MKHKSTPNHRKKLPICHNLPKVKKNHAPERKQARKYEYDLANDWFTGKKVMKVEEDGTVKVGEKPINDFGFTTIATFLRLNGYQVPRRLKKKDLIDGVKSWIQKQTPKQEDMKRVPKMTKTVEVIWGNEKKSTLDDTTIKRMQDNIHKLEFEVGQLKDEIALNAVKKPTENNITSNEKIVGMKNSGNDCWLIVALHAIHIIFNELIEAEDPINSSFAPTLGKQYNI